MATSSANTEVYDPSTFWVAPSRNFRTSARLHLQHTLFQKTLGFLLEPSIEAAITGSPSPIKIADIACGNGVWVTEVHTHLANAGVSAQLDGFDINPVNFPHAAHLPANITFTQLDVFAQPLPAALLGAYDVVHVRAFVSLIANGDLAPLLGIAFALLKPGGYIQWEETRGDGFVVEAPEGASRVSCDAVAGIIKAGAKGLSNDWVETLDAGLERFGFCETRLYATRKRELDFKGWTEDYLMVWEDLAVFFPPRAEKPEAPLTREAWVDLFAKAVGETEQGVVIHQGKVFAVVGRKPLS